MIIKSVSLQNHPGIGNIDISFMDGQGSVFPTVIFAGGNGCGKTAILEAIHSVFEGKLNGRIGIVTLAILMSSSEISNLFNSMGRSPVMLPPDNEFTLTYNSNIADTWNGAFTFHWQEAGGSMIEFTDIPISHEMFQGVFRSYYSEVSINFDAGSPQSITSMDIDVHLSPPKRSGRSLASEITQLIIDIRSADAEDVTTWVEENPGMPVPAGVPDKRFSRFRSAFNYMFPSKRFKGVSRVNNQLVVQFIENGKLSNINQLSTGEKQIVFRAGFILRDLANTNNGIILIDEPELSLHPEWQEKIVGFYTALLSDSAGNHPQLFIATHSPFIVHGSPGAKIVILQRDQNTGRVTEMGSPSFPVVKGIEALYAFNIDAFLSSARQQMLVLTEGDTDAQILNSAWRALRPNITCPVEFRPALGAKNINITLNDRELFSKTGNRLIVGLFDFDDAYDHWKGVWTSKTGGSTIVSNDESRGIIKKHLTKSGWAMLLPRPSFRSNYASSQLAGDSLLSIEFMFEDSVIPAGLIANRPIALGQQQPYVVPSQKSIFPQHVASMDASKFVSFIPLFERFDDIIAGRI